MCSASPLPSDGCSTAFPKFSLPGYNLSSRSSGNNLTSVLVVSRSLTVGYSSYIHTQNQNQRRESKFSLGAETSQ